MESVFSAERRDSVLLQASDVLREITKITLGATAAGITAI
jgi:hypothetical protein